MAGDKTSEFPTASALDGTELVALVQGGADKKSLLSVIKTFVISTLGTMAAQAASAVAITGGTIAGITDLAIADGGTGASSAATARSNLQLTNTARLSPADPAATASTSGVMTGVGGVVKITPGGSGKVQVTIRGTLRNTGAAGNGATVSLAYGSGTAPANGAAPTGTGAGTFARLVNPSTDFYLPFTLTDIVSGLTPGTSYWFDMNLRATTGGSASVLDLIATIVELP